MLNNNSMKHNATSITKYFGHCHYWKYLKISSSFSQKFRFHIYSKEFGHLSSGSFQRIFPTHFVTNRPIL